MRASTWVSKKMKPSLRAIMRKCPKQEVREEGLACLRGDKPEYLCNLIKSDHPDRVAAIRWLTGNQD